MYLRQHLLAAAGFSVLLAFSHAAHAVPLTVNYDWDFTGTEAVTGNPTGAITTGPHAVPANVTYSFQSNSPGNPLVVQAFRQLDGGSTFDWSRVTRNAHNGLGVSRQNLLIGGDATIDNLGTATDLLLFDFGTDNLFDTWTIDFTLHAINSNASLWVGNNLTSGDDMSGLNFNTLVASAGFELIDSNLNVPLNDPYTFSTGNSYRYLVISAQISQDDDSFRIGRIGASGAVQVPTPGILVLFATGLLGLAVRGFLSEAGTA